MAFRDYFCCLNGPERAALVTCVSSYVLTLGLFIPADVFDVQWVLVDVSAAARKAAFISLYSMRREEIVPDGTDTPLDVYTFNDPSLWAEVVAFVLGPSGVCLDGCEYQRFD